MNFTVWRMQSRKSRKHFNAHKPAGCKTQCAVEGGLLTYSGFAMPSRPAERPVTKRICGSKLEITAAGTVRESHPSSLIL